MQKYFASILEPNHTKKELPAFHQAKRWLDCHCEEIDLRRFCRCSCQTPSSDGSMTTSAANPVTAYGEIAAQIVKKQGAALCLRRR